MVTPNSGTPGYGNPIMQVQHLNIDGEYTKNNNYNS